MTASTAHGSATEPNPIVTALRLADLPLVGDCVTELADHELKVLAAILDNVVVRLRAEQDARRRGRSVHGPARLGARTSCVFCRGVYVVNVVPGHLLLNHGRELRRWWTIQAV